jgi:hypothetical protein
MQRSRRQPWPCAIGAGGDRRVELYIVEIYA